MKVNNWLLHIGLFITVMISLALSAIIWFNPAIFQRDAKTTTATDAGTSTKTNKKMSDVYLPIQIVKNENGGSYQLSSSKVDLIQKLQKQIKNWNFVSISQLNYKNTTEYQKLLSKNNTVALNYGSSVTVELFNQAFGQQINKFKNAKYNRILVLLGNKRQLYLMNDQKKIVYLVKFKNRSLGKYVNSLNSKDLLQLPVSYTLEADQYQLNYSEPVSLPSYSYLINKANESSLVPQLLSSSSQSTITTKVQKNKTIYTDGEDNRMTINNQTGKIEFSSYSRLNYYEGTQRTHVRKLSYYDRLKQSYLRISSISNFLDGIRFASYNLNNQQVVFNSFVAGFPVINENNYGSFEIQIMDLSGQRYSFSLYSLQVQVPSSNQRITLPSTSQIERRLLQAGFAGNKINQIKIGYRWQTNQSSKLVVDLIPTYFIDYNGQWISYQDLLATKAEQ
jgi:regulatory protein YycH of two-component signal transduction system YycFG